MLRKQLAEDSLDAGAEERRDEPRGLEPATYAKVRAIGAR
jgi:hypothetical protein